MKEILELIEESFGTLTLNKLRTGLAILGIVIGIGSVIALVSLGQASQQSIQSQISSLGANLLTVSPSSQSAGGIQSANANTSLTNADAVAIASSTLITTIGAVSPEVDVRSQVSAGKNNANIRVNGSTAAYASVHK